MLSSLRVQPGIPTTAFPCSTVGCKRAWDDQSWSTPAADTESPQTPSPATPDSPQSSSPVARPQVLAYCLAPDSCAEPARIQSAYRRPSASHWDYRCPRTAKDCN